MKVHTQAEVAKILRKSLATVYRLRRSGALAFIPGRPVTITDNALRAYLARVGASPAASPQEAAGDAALSPATKRDAFQAGRLLARSRRDMSLEGQGRLLAARRVRRTIAATDLPPPTELPPQRRDATTGALACGYCSIAVRLAWSHCSIWLSIAPEAQ